MEGKHGGTGGDMEGRHGETWMGDMERWNGDMEGQEDMEET